jgi:hypothetical protein
MLMVTSIEDRISDCVELLNHYPASTLIYDLARLCPDDFDVILNLIRLDLSQPHEHKHLRKMDLCLASFTYEKLHAKLRAVIDVIPPEEYSHFWLELTKRWLLTCPLDSAYSPDESGKDLFCQKLRSELVERILNIT